MIQQGLSDDLYVVPMVDQHRPRHLLAVKVARCEPISSELMNMGTFWYKSVYCGVVARLLASRCGLFDSEQLFVTGLLSDIGHLVMYQQLPELSQQSIVRSREEGVALYKVER